MARLEVKRVRTDSLLLDPANARRHGERNLEAIRGSLGRFGQVEPIVVQARSNRVIGGNGRLEALRSMGREEVDVVFVDLDDLNATALAIALNRSAELASWDEVELARLLTALNEQAIEVSELGFSPEDLAQLSPEPTRRFGSEADDAPDLPLETWVRPGDVFRLGEHVLVCGDCLAPGVLERATGGAPVALCWTDPPYNRAYDSETARARVVRSHKPRHSPIVNDELEDRYPEFCESMARLLASSLALGAPLYLAAHPGEWSTVDVALRRAFHWSSTIVWAKNRFNISRRDYHAQYELVWYGWREGAARLHPVADRTQSDLWEIPRPQRSAEHPTMKPIELIARAIENSSAPGALVLDLFLGSGSTLIACESTGRRCAAVEIEPRYVQVAIERWQTLTSRKAERIEGAPHA